MQIDVLEAGWPVTTAPEEIPRTLGMTPAERRAPDQVWIDAGYQPETVYAFTRGAGERYRACKGHGASQEPGSGRAYVAPKTTGSVIVYNGDGYHIARLDGGRQWLVEVSADRWKSWVHRRLATPLVEPGALAFFEGGQWEHTAIVRHLLAEVQREEFIAGRGTVVRWEALHRNNHWLDALYLAAAAAHLCGLRIVGAAPAPAVAHAERRPGLSMPDGRPYLISERT